MVELPDLGRVAHLSGPFSYPTLRKTAKGGAPSVLLPTLRTTREGWGPHVLFPTLANTARVGHPAGLPTGMLYAPKLSTCSKAPEIKETESSRTHITRPVNVQIRFKGPIMAELGVYLPGVQRR